MKLRNFREKSDFEMINVLGSSGSFGDGGTGVIGGVFEATDCSTQCRNGSTVEIKKCIGTCTAVDGNIGYLYRQRNRRKVNKEMWILTLVVKSLVVGLHLKTRIKC